MRLTKGDTTVFLKHRLRGLDVEVSGSDPACSRHDTHRDDSGFRASGFLW